MNKEEGKIVKHDDKIINENVKWKKSLKVYWGFFFLSLCFFFVNKHILFKYRLNELTE